MVKTYRHALYAPRTVSKDTDEQPNLEGETGVSLYNRMESRLALKLLSPLITTFNSRTEPGVRSSHPPHHHPPLAMTSPGSTTSSSETPSSYTSRMLHRVRHEQQVWEQAIRSHQPGIWKIINRGTWSSSQSSSTPPRSRGSDAPGGTGAAPPRKRRRWLRWLCRRRRRSSAEDRGTPSARSSLEALRAGQADSGRQWSVASSQGSAPWFTLYRKAPEPPKRTFKTRMRDQWSTLLICCGRKSVEGPD
ncbi:hypothetical protein F4780DRAFT_790808 [Xylariomycetidae sp. FL0641]|nr:hypothetical protein F4780DRAFT_790808 [Xylariomycetidae sp. FL0641]